MFIERRRTATGQSAGKSGLLTDDRPGTLFLWPQSDAAAWSRRLWSNTNDKGEGNGFFWASSAFPDDRRAQCGGAGRFEGVSDGERQAGALRSNQVSPKSIMDKAQLLVLVVIQAVTAVGFGDDPSCHSLSLIHIWRCRRYSLCRSRWSPYH